MGLVGSARKTELLLHIAIDAKVRADAFRATDFSKLSGSSLDQIFTPYLGLTKKQFGSQLSETFTGEILDELNSIREIAGALAHAQIFKTRERIMDHLKKYSCSSQINENQLPGILFQMLKDNSGQSYEIAYLPKSSPKNSKMLEWELFVHNDYATVCKELFLPRDCASTPEIFSSSA